MITYGRRPTALASAFLAALASERPGAKGAASAVERLIAGEEYDDRGITSSASAASRSIGTCGQSTCATTSAPCAV